MQFIPKFTGEWYKIQCHAGQKVDLEGVLAEKAERNDNLFTKVGRKRKTDDQDES